jgi:hypothetical protein
VAIFVNGESVLNHQRSWRTEKEVERQRGDYGSCLREMRGKLSGQIWERNGNVGSSEGREPQSADSSQTCTLKGIRYSPNERAGSYFIYHSTDLFVSALLNF